MIKLIIGKKGSGKTKELINDVHDAINVENGNIVFICNGDRHVLDLNHSVRLIDTSEFDTADYRVFKSFINGILSQNYDITSVFIDSLFKIVPDDMDNLPAFVDDLEAISASRNIKFTICISADKEDLPQEIYQYIA
ncbi:MAG: ATP-binding protein [Ruminococcaceae bacterium]|nr:ATP-binding protein [Oscillospiraceae bacterium]